MFRGPMFYGTCTLSQTKKKKSLTQEVRQKSDISDRRNKPPSTLTSFATRPPGHCATGEESFYDKNEYNQKLDAEYSLFNNFFEKSSIFRENHEKLFWGHI